MRQWSPRVFHTPRTKLWNRFLKLAISSDVPSAFENEKHHVSKHVSSAVIYVSNQRTLESDKVRFQESHNIYYDTTTFWHRTVIPSALCTNALQHVRICWHFPSIHQQQHLMPRLHVIFTCIISITTQHYNSIAIHDFFHKLLCFFHILDNTFIIVL